MTEPNSYPNEEDICRWVEQTVLLYPFVCPLCRRSSANPNDAANRYCGCCGNDLLPKDCPHRTLVA